MNNATTRPSARFYAFAAILFAAALSRVLPHPPNVAPMTAMALFAGAFVADKRFAVLLPLCALLASDVALEALTGWGFYSDMWVVYAAFVLVAALGFRLRARRSAARIAGFALVGSLAFFATTNFGVWALGSLYPHTTDGLLACYVAALPFFQNSLLGDAAYCALLFGGFALAERAFPALLAEKARA